MKEVIKMLRMNERPSGDVMILDLGGTIAAGTSAIEMGDKVRSILFRGYRKLLLNLEGATSSDPSGVSAFLGALIDAREVGADVRLVNVTRRMTDLTIIVALYRYFSAFESEDEAVASFGAEHSAPVDNGTSRWLEPVAAA
jgi:anti-anti-sigma factor